MEAAVAHQFDAAGYCLQHHLLGLVAAEADMYTCIDESLEQKIDEAGPGAAQAGGHIEVVFVGHVDGLAHGLKNGLGGGAVGVGYGGGVGPNCHAFADLGGGIGHGADDFVVAEAGLERFDTYTCHDTDYERVVGQVSTQVCHDQAEDLGLDGQNDD